MSKYKVTENELNGKLVKPKLKNKKKKATMKQTKNVTQKK